MNKYMLHLPLIIALALPVVFIVGVLIVTLPNRTVETPYAVVLARCPDQGGYWRPCAIHTDAAYTVVANKIVYTPTQPLPTPPGEKPQPFIEPEIIVFTPATQRTVTLSREDALSRTLVGTEAAPDGTQFEYRYGRGGEFFPFVSSSRTSGWYVVNGSRAMRVESADIGLEQYAGTDRLDVLGWVTN